ncbi:hypothetical protein F4604DRAFT_1938953 [Suillus subluteus]|nr:hypothetical protein F4604DRAFT_1938953 [Suillus subluteus]
MPLIPSDPTSWSFNMYRVSNYFIVASSAAVVYDWGEQDLLWKELLMSLWYSLVLTFGQECELIWRQRRSLMTVLYIIVRCIGLLYSVSNVLCNAMNLALSWTIFIVNPMLSVILITRLYAMFRSRKMLIFLVVTFCSVLVVCGVIGTIGSTYTPTNVILLNGTQCISEVNEGEQLSTLQAYIVATVWHVLTLCLAIWIFAKRFRELQPPLTGQTFIGDCFIVLIKTQVFYFTIFTAGCCLNIGLISPMVSDTTRVGGQIYWGFLELATLLQMFVVGPRLILSIRKYHADLLPISEDGTFEMPTIDFQALQMSTGSDLNIPVPKESKYNFSDFSLDADWTAEIGEAADVNRELEARFGSRAGGLKIVERGPEPEAVVDVLETWIKKYPGDILLEKWVYDTLEAARGLIPCSRQHFLDVEVDSTKHKPVNVNNHQPEKRKKSAASKTAPSVKWRDMHATWILSDQQPEKPTVVPPPARPREGRWPDDGDDVSLDGEKSDRFDVGDHINLSSGFLLDILSDQPVQLEPTAPVSHGPPFELTAGAVTSSTTPMDDEWEIWVDYMGFLRSCYLASFSFCLSWYSRRRSVTATGKKAAAAEIPLGNGPGSRLWILWFRVVYSIKARITGGYANYCVVVDAQAVGLSVFHIDVDDSQFTAFVDSIGEDCSGNRQNLALIAATTNFDDTVDFLFPPRILKDAGTCLDRAFLSPLNVYVGEFNVNILGNLLDDLQPYFSSDSLKEAEHTHCTHRNTPSTTL